MREEKIKSGLVGSGLVKQDFKAKNFRLRGLSLNTDMDFVPKVESARIAVERARKIVKENDEMISRLKEESNIEISAEDTFAEAANFSHEDSYAFDLYKIKSTNGISDFIKDVFGMF